MKGMPMKTVSTLVLLLAVTSTFAANTIERTDYRFLIDPNQSTLQLFRTVVPPEPVNGTLLPFGGIIDITVTDYYVDTNDFNGQPLTPKTFSAIKLEVSHLDLPELTVDFSLENLPRFVLDNQTIPGGEHDICAYFRATGGSCSGQTLYNGFAPSLSGSFDGEVLEVSGFPFRSFGTPEYYNFNIVAAPVPIPSSLLLLCSALVGVRRFNRVSARSLDTYSAN